MGMYDKVLYGGEYVTRQHRALIRAAAVAAGLDPNRIYLAQGSWSTGSLSGNTHAGRSAADIRVHNIPANKLFPFVRELRRRGAGATWLRSPQYGGWTTGDHIHSLLGAGFPTDDPGLSDSAKRQIAAWKRGSDGLGNYTNRDYHDRPTIWNPVSWRVISPLASGTTNKLPHVMVLRLQKALAKYVGLNYVTGPGIFGKRTREAFRKAEIKSGLKGVDLICFLGYNFGFRPTY